MPASNGQPPQYLEGWHPVVGWIRGIFVSMTFPRTDKEACESFRQTRCTNSPKVKLDCGNYLGPMEFWNIRGTLTLGNGSTFEFVPREPPHAPLIDVNQPMQFPMEYMHETEIGPFIWNPGFMGFNAGGPVFPQAPTIGFDPASGPDQIVWYAVPHTYPNPLYSSQEMSADEPKEEITNLTAFMESLKAGFDGAKEIRVSKFTREGGYSDN